MESEKLAEQSQILKIQEDEIHKRLSRNMFGYAY